MDTEQRQPSLGYNEQNKMAEKFSQLFNDKHRTKSCKIT